jgi:hypothetical protein
MGSTLLAKQILMVIPALQKGMTYKNPYYMEIVNLRDKHGNTPLHLASLTGNDEIRTMLLQRGADTEILNNQGLTADEVNYCKGVEGKLSQVPTQILLQSDKKETKAKRRLPFDEKYSNQVTQPVQAPVEAQSATALVKTLSNAQMEYNRAKFMLLLGEGLRRYYLTQDGMLQMRSIIVHAEEALTLPSLSAQSQECRLATSYVLAREAVEIEQGRDHNRSLVQFALYLKGGGLSMLADTEQAKDMRYIVTSYLMCHPVPDQRYPNSSISYCVLVDRLCFIWQTKLDRERVQPPARMQTLAIS